MKKKCAIAVVLIIAISLLCSISVVAADAEIQGSAQIAGTNVSLNWSNTTRGRMGLFYAITASDTMDIIGANKVEFYRYMDDQWVLESTLTPTAFPDLLDYNTSNHSLMVVHTAAYLNVPYKAVVYFYCYGPYGTSTLTQTSNFISGRQNLSGGT